MLRGKEIEEEGKRFAITLLILSSSSCYHALSLSLSGLNNLKELEYLDVSSNQLSRLRVDLKDLTLRTFIVADNPLESPPMQVCVG